LLTLLYFFRIAKIKARKKRQERERKEQETAARRNLANMRVVQKNLVYVIGLPSKICHDEVSFMLIEFF